uniref:B3 domain-containing protein Os01g0234100-like isoform X1 n=1 Tax=Fragaria vesca subsp. vesca TaxID=101020 RepID=UPI0005CB1D01|nr:PREDICTED: B3 domain-containing protein Os01g0234100-like isoform X1 [Fragaria vesca subsp. vesca]
MWLLLSLFFLFLGSESPPLVSSEEHNLMGPNIRKGTPQRTEKKENKPKTPPSKPKPKPTTKRVPTPPGNQKKTNKLNEKEVEHSLPMKELSNTQVNKMLEQAALGHSGKSTPSSSTQYDILIEGSPSRGQAKSSAIIRAQEVRSKLDPTFPSFVKSLLRSHVASCFWMGLPSLFCKSHLPDKDITMTLEDEGGRQLQSKYIACKTGLSAGWRQFAASHKLLEGDVLVFQLVEPAKFKVYVIRSNDFTEVDGALGLLNLDAQTKHNDADKDNAEPGAVACNESNRKRTKSPPEVVQKKKKIDLPVEYSEIDSEETDSEVVENSRLPGTTLQFEDIKSYENFNILVNGLLVDSEFPEDIRIKYYKLCCSQNAFLHENVMKGTDYKLIVGAIVETVHIVDAIKACQITTTQDDFVCWDRYLRAFELLGMNVGFIRVRLCRLANLAFDSEDAMDAKTYKEARKERARAGLGLRNIETKIQELREACHDFSSAIESLRSKAEVYNHRFQEEVTAPW